MSGWGFDFSQVSNLSLTGLGEKLQQLAADAESSIESQLRSERRVTKPEEQKGDSTKGEQGGSDGWGFEALGGLASAVLGSSGNRTASPARRSPGSAQPSREVDVLPRPVPFWAGAHPVAAGGAGPSSSADGSSSGGLGLPEIYTPPPQQPQPEQQPQPQHQESKQHRLGAMRLGAASPTSPPQAASTRLASKQSLDSPTAPVTAASAASEEAKQPPLLGEELDLSTGGASPVTVAREPIGPVAAVLKAAGAAVGEPAEGDATVAPASEYTGAAVVQPPQDAGVEEPAAAPATSTPGVWSEETAARDPGSSQVAGPVSVPPFEQQGPLPPQESSPGHLMAGSSASVGDLEVQQPERVAAATERQTEVSADEPAAVAEAEPVTRPSFAAARAGEELAAETQPIPAGAGADEEEQAATSGPAQAAGLLLAVEARTNGLQPQEQGQDQQQAPEEQQGSAAGQAQQQEEQPTVPAVGEAALANGQAEAAAAAVDATPGDYEAAVPSVSDRDGEEGVEQHVQPQGVQQHQAIGLTEEGRHAAAEAISEDTGGEQAGLAGKHSEAPVGAAAVAPVEQATATEGPTASGQPATSNDSGNNIGGHHSSGTDGENLQRTVGKLREALAERERQIERKAQEVAQQQAAMDALVRKNEELILQRASVSESDVEDMRRDFEQRLAASERKVYALTKERDALRRGSDKLSSMDDLIREKDSIIKQVMEEGEALSRKQMQQEQTIRKLRAQVKELQTQVTELGAKLAAETSRADGASAERATAAAELAALREAHAVELLAERQHLERQITEARAAQVAAENKALDAAKQGGAKKLRDSETRVEALEATVAELRDELERQRAAADGREDLLSAEVAELQRRCGEAEARQQEAAARLPEATAPLLRQIEAMQEEAHSASLAWAEAERALAQRLRAAEDATAAAKRAQSILEQQVEEAQEATAEALQALREVQQQLQAATAAVEAERAQRAAAETTTGYLRSDLAAAQDSLRTLEQVYAQQMDAVQQREANAVSKLRALEFKQQQQEQGGSAADGPPALAAPGYKWVLIKDGERSPSNGGHPSSAAMAGAGAGAGTSISRHASYASRASAAGDEFEPGRTASTDGQEGQQQQQHQRVQGQAALRSGAAAAAAAARKGSTASLRQEREDGMGEEEEDTTIRGLTLWGSGVSGLSMHSMGAGAPPAPSGADSHQLLTLKQAVRELEATRDRLSEELVRASTEAQQGSAAQQRVEVLEAELTELRRRHDACLQLLGERQEQLDELREDLEEIKLNYRQQIDFMAGQMVQLREQA